MKKRTNPPNPRPRTISPTSNITVEVKKQFEALSSGKYKNFALFSCFFEGEPTSVIVAVSENAESGLIDVIPMFLAITENMCNKITDHNNETPTNLNDSETV